MTKFEQAIEVLSRAQDQLVGEIAICGQSGGVGRAQNYAPVLVHIHNALEIVKAMVAPSEPTPEQTRMAAVRAAKQSKSV
jgi:hypothetical protein